MRETGDMGGPEGVIKGMAIERQRQSGQRVGFVHKIRGGDVGLPHGHK